MSKEFKRGVGIAVVQNNTVAVSTRLASYSQFFPDMLQFPGGAVEDGETFEEGAVRELYEETGLLVDQRRLIPFIDRPIYLELPEVPTYWAMHFLVQLLSNEVLSNPEPHKHTNWKFIPWAGIEKRNMAPWTLECLKISKSALLQ